MSKGITNDYYLNTSQYTYTDKKDNGELGKDAFLKILITQLQNQDPTNPMDDREFIAQMAQFSSLEQMQNMTKAMENLLMSQQETQLMSYTNFIGKSVKWHELSETEVDEKGNSKVIEGSGTITELKFKDGLPIFVLDSGKEIFSGNISSILGTGAATTSPPNPFQDASNLIGQMIQYTNSAGKQLTATIAAVIKNATGIEYILDNDERLKRDEFELVATEEATKDEE